jgi:hypothetical protein
MGYTRAGNVDRFVLVLSFVAWVAAGCTFTHHGSEEGPEMPEIIDGSAPDSGHAQDGSLEAGPGPGADAGSDSGVPAGSDAGHESDTGPRSDGSVDGDAAVDEESFVCSNALPERSSLGTPEEPYLIALADAPLIGTLAWRGRAFLRFTGVTLGKRYTIWIEPERGIELAVFAADQTFLRASCVETSYVPSRTVAACDVVAQHDTIDVSLDAIVIDQYFSLKIAPALEPEGTVAAPVPVALAGDEARVSVASTVAPSYYELTGLASGQTYEVSAGGAAESVVLSVFADASFEGAHDSHTDRDAHAYGTAVGGSLFIKLEAPNAGAYVDLVVAPTSGMGQGTLLTPIALAAPNASIELGWAYAAEPALDPLHNRSESYAVLTGVSPGPHVVTLRGQPGNRLSVYGDSYANTPTNAAAFVGDTAAAGTRTTTGLIYVKVSNEAGPGGPVELEVGAPLFVAEGTSDAPVQLDIGELPAMVRTEPGIHSFYAISGFTPGETYHFSMSGSQRPLIALYDGDAAFASPACTVRGLYGTPPHCGLTVTSTTIYVRVMTDPLFSSSSVGAEASIDVTRVVAQTEGTAFNPIRLDCLDHAYTGTIGQAALTTYELTNLEEGRAYLVEVVAESRIELSLYSGEGSSVLSADVCKSEGDELMPARCTQTAVDGSVFVMVQGNALGSAFELRVTPTDGVREGALGAPRVLDVASAPFGHLGHATPGQPSYYELANMTPDRVYILRVASAREPVTIALHHSDAFDSEYGAAQASLGSPLELALLADSLTDSQTSVFFSARLIDAGDGSDLHFDVFESPEQSEGVGTPLVLDDADFPHDGTVDNVRASNYEVGGLTPGEDYTLTISNASRGTPNLTIYSQGNWVPTQCEGNAATAQACTFTTEGATIYVVLSFLDVPSASYTLDFQPAE